MKKLVWLGSFSYLLIGLAHVVVGAVLINLLQHYDLEYIDGGQFIFLQFFGFLLGVLTTPWWTHVVGKKGLLTIALATLTVVQILYGLLPPWSIMLIAAPFAGFGFGVVEAVIGAFVIDAIQQRKAVAISRLELAFGIGAFMMPALASLFIWGGVWYISFYVVAICSLLMLIAWLKISLGEFDQLLSKQAIPTAGHPPRKRYPKASLPVLVIMIVFFAIYVGLEMSLVNFLPAMMIERYATTEAVAALSVSLFWMTMIIGRFFAGMIAEWVNYSRYMIWSCIGTLLFLIGFASAGTIWSSYAFILLIGLMMAGIFGVGLVFTNHVIPGMTERTTSLLIAAAGTGGAFVPLLIGWGMDIFALKQTFMILIGFTVLMTILMIIGSLRSRSYWSRFI